MRVERASRHNICVMFVALGLHNIFVYLFSDSCKQKAKL